MKAYFEAHGCSMNIGESRELRDRMLSLGWEQTTCPEGADLAVLSTCVVVAKTERDMLKRVAALSSHPRLLVTGCLAAVCREKVLALAPQAELIDPVHLGPYMKGLTRVGPPVTVEEEGACVTIPLATGCTGSCSYCITRIARGGLRSRPAEGIVDAAAEAVRDGPREVRLTAQDTASYGTDIGTDLPSLVSSVCSVPSDFRVRIGMMNPRSVLPIADRVADMYLEPKVFRFLHMPVQSGSDRVLGLMNRGYTAQEFVDILRTVRSRAPELSLSTDIIIGYPGEEEDDHEANMDIIVKARPDIVNVTKFSPRPGTKASEERNRVDGRTVKERSRQITKVRFEVSRRINAGWIGRETRALATEHVKHGTTVLRTDEYRQVVVHEELDLGVFHDVVIEDATPTYLMGSRRD